MPAIEFLELLRALNLGRIDLVLVGGLAAVLQGAPVDTFDVDVVHSRERANLDRLLAVLADLDAVYRLDPGRRLRPALSHLASTGHQSLLTRLGPLDLLGSIGEGLVYADLLPRSEVMDLGGDVRVHVLNLAELIRLKEELGGEKDRATLPILRQTLRERG